MSRNLVEMIRRHHATRAPTARRRARGRRPGDRGGKVIA
jgi:hypothetical protein